MLREAQGTVPTAAAAAACSRRGRIEQAVSALGVLQPQRYVDVGAQVSGQIRRIAVKACDVVAQGDLLVEIDPTVQRATVQADRATLDSLRAQRAEQEAQHDLVRLTAERQQRLIAVDSTRQEDADTARANLRMAQVRPAPAGW
ncbi:biotin/lipoyl-binding protein [Thauera linaloolentis]|uniref:Putative periplasmic protein n=1 Tax=Thauera linaloolentis (strain DSM 12138 / JCM 21573 / CCUG 41526 / CIP 105981 / IAM 15112 / NBRC 102519 / 47Lol) TaxID=1123367 RepID=N6YSC4_THAL4|nr:biotin/lipoyl-binding protein [Thauera linaloolentis]ENO85272.1 putative periplasmic protein [Thauera linaloolentis 47Lol = DSM 12138]MCM8564961.1 biotin/lipoyl-binding protein [Thauera linaloolentis]